VRLILPMTSVPRRSTILHATVRTSYKAGGTIPISWTTPSAGQRGGGRHMEGPAGLPTAARPLFPDARQHKLPCSTQAMHATGCEVGHDLWFHHPQFDIASHCCNLLWRGSLAISPRSSPCRQCPAMKTPPCQHAVGRRTDRERWIPSIPSSGKTKVGGHAPNLDWAWCMNHRQ